MPPRRENSRRRGDAVVRSDTVLVLCGGRRTEPDYLDGLRQTCRRSGLKVRVIGKGLDPGTLVRHARTVLARERGAWDEVWCVVDVDDFDLEPAARAAGVAGVKLAVSNPCFELWLLLHFEDRGSPVDGAGDARRLLSQHLPGYDKTRLMFADFAPGVDRAIERARRLDQGSGAGTNPSSGVWRLVDTIVRGTR